MLVAVFMLFVVGAMAALAIDVVTLYTARSEAQLAADGAALAAARRLPIALSTFLGQLAGGQAVKIVGNERPISKQTLLNSGLSLLNY